VEKNKLRLLKALAIAKIWFSTIKKLLNIGVDLTLQRRGEKKQPGQNERQL
jgi:hypothetical protein